MDEEIKNLIKVWISAIISISYCYYITARIKAGVSRLLFVLPICAMFLLFPLFFSSVHFSAFTTFFLTWLANFKLILFSFDKGPLFPLPNSFFRFLCFTCFPIKAEQNPKPYNHSPKWIFAVKVSIFVVLLHLHAYIQNLPPVLILGFYFVHLYLKLEIVLTYVKVLVFISLGCDLEPQSNKPYLATSLQDFWGRRWNIMVPAILRPAIYSPMRRVSERRMSSGWALFPGILAAFIVSGLVHELLFFYLIREKPTWEVTLYFVLHGICTAAELAVKKKIRRRWQLSPAVSRLLTVGFVLVTSFWLFSPQLIRNGAVERFISEDLLLVDFVKANLFVFFGLFATNV